MGLLAGRQRELAIVRAMLDAAESGRGHALVAVGEPGIGKSRLLEEAAVQASARGFAIAWGRAWEVSTAPPYWPWIEALRELVAAGTPAGALGDLLPELGGRHAETDALRFYDAVVAFLQVASSRQPIAIVLDDLHAADLSSLRLVELVAPHLRRMRAVVIGSYRDIDARRSPSIDTALGRIARYAETVHLVRLDEPAVGELVRASLGHDDSRATRMIHDASDGNPLFVTELLKLVAARGAASARDVPAGVRALIRERLAYLSPATVALLQAAALVGRTFGLAIAAELGGVTPLALDEAIAEAVAAEVVQVIDIGRYRFSHALVAETLVADLAPGVRAKLHRRAAEVLERLGDSDVLAEIARHWVAAGAEHAAHAIDAAVRAAEAAEQRVAFDDAAELYDVALASLAIAAPGDSRRRAELLIAQAAAYVRGGDRTRAVAPCTQAADIARSLRDSVLFARAALALGADAAVATIDPVLIELLEGALELLPATDDKWHAMVAARLAAARQPTADPDAPIALARDAIAMARRIGDQAVLRDVLFLALGAFVDFADPAERMALNEELLGLFAGRDVPRTLRTLQRLTFDYAESGDLVGFERTVARYEAVGRATGRPRYQWVPLLFRAMRAHWEGRSADAERWSEEAYAIRERFDDTVPIIRKVRRYMHDGFATAGADLEPITDIIAGGDEEVLHTLRGWAYIGAGRPEDVAREGRWLRDRPASPATPILHTLNAYAAIAWELRDQELARRHQAVGRAYAGRVQIMTSVAFLFNGVIDHGLMRTAAILDQWDDAHRFAESAIQLCERIGAHALREQIEHERGLLGVRPAAPRPAPSTVAAVSIRREGDYWTVTAPGVLCRIKDSRGMQLLARLVDNPKREHHVLDLVSADVVDAGDSGVVMDRAARDQYVNRARQLQAELEQARAWNDRGREERIEAELDAIAAQLTAAYGLGGREKRAGSATERARTSVRRRLTDAIQRIADASPALGRHFTTALKTGVICVYDPDR